MEWKESAQCKDLDVDLFYLARGEEISPIVISTCNVCPVRKECLDWALKHESIGYWAGTSARAREKMRKKLNMKYISSSYHLDISK